MEDKKETVINKDQQNNSIGKMTVKLKVDKKELHKKMSHIYSLQRQLQSEIDSLSDVVGIEDNAETQEQQIKPLSNTDFIDKISKSVVKSINKSTKSQKVNLNV